MITNGQDPSFPLRVDSKINVKDAQMNAKTLTISVEADIMNMRGGNTNMTAEALSTRFINSSEQLYGNADKIKPIENYEDIVIHGDKTGFAYHDNSGKEHYYTVHEFASILKDSEVYGGGNIRLISCEAGADGATAAQALADLLKVDVMAPSDVVWIMPDGSMTIGITPSVNDGEWRIFKPKAGE